MTEEEKKEFEEFLKWKAEKAKQAASTETEESPDIPVDDEDAKPQKGVDPQTNTACKHPWLREQSGMQLLNLILPSRKETKSC